MLIYLIQIIETFHHLIQLLLQLTVLGGETLNPFDVALRLIHQKEIIQK